MKIIKFNYKKFINQIFIALGALFAVALIFAYLNSAFEKPSVITLSELVSKINNSEVSKIVINNDDLEVTLKDNNKYSAKKEIESSLTETLKNYGVDGAKLGAIEIKVEQSVGFNFWVGTVLPLLLPFLLVGFLIWYMMRQANRANMGAFSFGKSQAKLSGPFDGRKKIMFSDVAGSSEAKEELIEVVDFLKNPKKFLDMGARIPRGVLLVGAPGTGKTLLARAVAGEANVPFFYISGSEFVEMFVGVGASRVRDLFNMAKKFAPSIVFIDEIDAVGRQRGAGLGGGHDEREQTLDALLEELDGFDKNCGIVVMAATNRPDILDEALIRPGRFDRQIQVPKPDLAGREMILKIHARNVVLGPEINLLEVAKDTAGMVGADLENVVNEAVLIATRKNKDYVEQSDFSEAVDKVSMGPARKSVKLTNKEKQRTAYHEAGHTLAAMLTGGADPVHKVTIIPRGPALGFTKQLPEDRHSITKKELEAMVAVCVAGRAAEEVKFGEITTGHSSDFEQATLLLKNMIYELGMDKEAGMAVYKEKTDFWGNPTGLDASQKTKELLEGAVKTKLTKIYNDVKELLVKERNKLDKLASQLMEKETLDANEIRAIINSA